MNRVPEITMIYESFADLLDWYCYGPPKWLSVKGWWLTLTTVCVKLVGKLKVGLKSDQRRFVCLFPYVEHTFNIQPTVSDWSWATIDICWARKYTATYGGQFYLPIQQIKARWGRFYFGSQRHGLRLHEFTTRTKIPGKSGWACRQTQVCKRAKSSGRP